LNRRKRAHVHGAQRSVSSGFDRDVRGTGERVAA
jgi:hypothetical protein